MARPRRRVLILLSIRIGVPLRELEMLDSETVRQYLVMLRELNKPSPAPDPKTPAKQQTPEEMMAAVGAALGHIKG
jgi:hypothetical protein